MPLTRWHAELAWTGLAVERDVLLEVADGRFSAVTPGVASPPDAHRLPGITIPGLANAHSHAFHRALRGHTQAQRGTFWTWRERMYALAAGLTPDTYLALARATFAEMALAGITCVGEFHYLHHGPGGQPYDDPNAMGHALIAAAAQAGIRITLLDTLYLAGGIGAGGTGAGGIGAGGIGQPLSGPQLRFGDGSSQSWAQRVGAITHGPHARPGAAIHSVRAVPPDSFAALVAWSHHHAAPIHVHLSEHQAENDSTLAAFGRSPAELLLDAGVLGPRTTAVHATHVTAQDIELLGQSDTTVCMCPTTERDLADGIGPAHALAKAGSPIALGTDSHAVIDLFEEARAVELDERLLTHERGHWPAADLLTAATGNGYTCLGWPEGGVLAPGALADFVTVRTDSVRMAGWRPEAAVESLVFAATAADVAHVVVGGRPIVKDGHHLLIGDVPGELQRVIDACYQI